MPRVKVEVTFGKTKLVALSAYQSRWSAVEPTEAGVAPGGSHRLAGFSIWQRKRTPPVGVPLGQPTGLFVLLQVMFMGGAKSNTAVTFRVQPPTNCLASV